MGFGYLFFGFLMMIELGVATSVTHSIGVDLFPDLAGYFLMLTAACRLTPYGKGFSRFRVALYPLLAVGGVTYLAGILSVFPLPHAPLATVLTVTKALSLVLQPIAFFFLFAGVASLALEVELPRIASSARRVTVFGAMYYFCQIAFLLVDTLPFKLNGTVDSVIGYVLAVAWLIFVICAEIVLFKCYMFICYEGEEQISPQDTVNPLGKFLNKFKKGKGD